MNYIIISPVRDEEKYLQNTIDSVVTQTILPLEWVIVNDGSTDRTGEIIDENSRKHTWIKHVSRGNRGYRRPGTGVVESFYDGFKKIEHQDYDYLIKLDGDLSFKNTYFEECFNAFNKNPRLGICGGGIYNVFDNYIKYEENVEFHVRGATKIYRRQCWDDIGGLIAQPGWDTFDEVKANMLGWETKTFKHLEVLHHRLTGTATGLWNGYVKNGVANYFAGYHPIFMIAKCFRWLFKKPVGIGACALFCGFMKGYIQKLPRIDDEKLRRYLRNQQMNKLLGKKSIWN